MADVDIFGKPLPKGDQHSKFFKSITSGEGSRTNKERYEEQKVKLDQRLENQKYRNKLNEMKEAHRKLTVAQIKNEVNTAKTKTSFISKLFK